MSIMSSYSALEHRQRVQVEDMRWMSLTSRLATVPTEPPSLACPNPQGRAAAEKGRPVPLVGQSERGRDALPVSIERPPGELVQTQHRV
jgi:hypothetical protein